MRKWRIKPNAYNNETKYNKIYQHAMQPSATHAFSTYTCTDILNTL